MDEVCDQARAALVSGAGGDRSRDKTVGAAAGRLRSRGRSPGDCRRCGDRAACDRCLSDGARRDAQRAARARARCTSWSRAASAARSPPTTCSIPFTPFGDCSLLRMANLYANVAHVSPADFDLCVDLVTTLPAKLMNLKDYGIGVGKPATFIVVEAESAVVGAGRDCRRGDGIPKRRADVFASACRIPSSIAPAVQYGSAPCIAAKSRASRNGSAPQRVDRVSRENTDTRQTQHGNQKFNHCRRPWRPATDTTLQRSCTVKGKACSGTALVGSDASLHQLTSVERAVAAR